MTQLGWRKQWAVNMSEQEKSNVQVADPSSGSAIVETVQKQAMTVFDCLGGAAQGEQRIRALVDRFYDLMDLEPEFATIRALHPPVLDESRNKLFWFLCGWMGGPDHFVARFGHPRLRARHLPYAIGLVERDQWLRCMAWAMQEEKLDEVLQQRLLQAFYQTADWMRNQPR